MCKLKIITSRYDEVEKQLRVILCPEGGDQTERGWKENISLILFFFIVNPILLLLLYTSHFDFKPRN
jgi:hypothetical protein